MELSQKSLTGIQKFLLFQVPMKFQRDWKAELESAYSFMLKYSKKQCARVPNTRIGRNGHFDINRPLQILILKTSNVMKYQSLHFSLN